MAKKDDVREILKPVYIKGGRDLKGVDSVEQFWATRDYLISIGITPIYFCLEKSIIYECSEPNALKLIKEIEKQKEEVDKKD